MTESLPMFPLNSVLFPGVSLPLRVFEDRYRALVRHLLEHEEPGERYFGSVAIREGYEVGDHGTQSLYRVGCRVLLQEAERMGDGTFEVTAVCVDRFQLDRLVTDGAFPVGVVRLLDAGPHGAAERAESVDPVLVQDAQAAFLSYRAELAEIAGAEPYEGRLPEDATFLSWALAANTPLPLAERQSLLEAEDAAERLHLVTRLLRAEVAMMTAIPSLPATEVARTRWSPN